MLQLKHAFFSLSTLLFISEHLSDDTKKRLPKTVHCHTVNVPEFFKQILLIPLNTGDWNTSELTAHHSFFFISLKLPIILYGLQYLPETKGTDR